MGKVLIAAFDDKDEIAFDELLLFLKSNSHIKVVNALISYKAFADNPVWNIVLKKYALFRPLPA